MTKYAVVLVIMDMASAKSDVNGPKKKYGFGDFELESDKKHKIFVSKHIDSLYIGLVKGSYIFVTTLD